MTAKSAPNVSSPPPPSPSCTALKRSLDKENISPVPLPFRSDSTVDILAIIKSALLQFNSNIIHLGSSRSYKNSKFLKVDLTQAAAVPRESVYDSEMYRVLVNWLTYSLNIEVTGQWHLKSIGSDGGFHHSYCDLVLKHPSASKPFAILELLATAIPSTLKKHFSQVSTYAQCLCPDEFWVVHFSRADDLLSSPYWPDESLLHQKLGMIHIWHDKEFKNVRLNAKFSFLNEIKTISNMQILP
ncbi:uncharacterized protein OCT59_014428 [Rhizophagus irregularis]|uniref:Restriction endonuclease domain-containing protein n=2 Tax=Rhizophagus irregularis TaxID=588596 RepID=A0A015KBA7_RHIIW|nr:hypothetical protein RirG_213090 [Rhizophagus irregularis DAOM 197198w]UZO22056.1 hypothetical protein OCT59_014428 [Rhizophagus irregularis]GBC44533.2 P-loop containing nucleoside triphosphate hydrolase protein [Rhizophagus irregularis DAOM 181602=DAOM 197198]CAG8662729.1 18300_t:CDS:2 [Rhizophagus irregularis]